MFEILGKVFPRRRFHLWAMKDLMCSLRPLACDVADWDCVYVCVRMCAYLCVQDGTADRVRRRYVCVQDGTAE